MYVSYYRVGQVVEGLVAQSPDLVEDHSVAPHVTGTGVLVVVQRLQSENQETSENMTNAQSSSCSTN